MTRVLEIKSRRKFYSVFFFFPSSTWTPILNLKKVKLQIIKYITDVFI